MSGLQRLYSPPEIGAPGKRQGRRLRRDLRLSGIFVVAMFVVLIGALTWLRPSLFGESRNLIAYFPNANGLTPGVPVVLEGYKIGALLRIEPVFSTAGEDIPCMDTTSADRSPILPCFRALLRIGDNWRIPVDSTIEIGSAGLLQGDAISILPGRGTESLQDQAAFRSPGRRNDLLSQAGTLIDSFRRLLEDKIDPTIAEIQQKIAMIQGMLDDSDSQPGEAIDYRVRLTGIFNNLDELIRRLKESVKPAEISSLMGRVEAVSNELQKTTGEIHGLIKENRPVLQRSLDDAQFLIQELAASLTPILTNIDDTTRNLSAISRDLRNNPAILLKGRQTKEEAPWFSDDQPEAKGTPWFVE